MGQQSKEYMSKEGKDWWGLLVVLLCQMANSGLVLHKWGSSSYYDQPFLASKAFSYARTTFARHDC
jgi:hypothetical protein